MSSNGERERLRIVPLLLKYEQTLCVFPITQGRIQDAGLVKKMEPLSTVVIEAVFCTVMQISTSKFSPAGSALTISSLLHLDDAP